MLLQNLKGYYFITDEKLSKRGNLSDCLIADSCNVPIIQYRNKNGNTRDMISEALKIKKVCNNSLFLVNDRIDVALAVNADGVHLGQDDMDYSTARRLLGSDKVIGISVGSIDEAITAEKIGADYLGVGPIFNTDTKSNAGDGLGINLIKKIKEKCRIPIVAIGGIKLSNAKQIIDAGADMICAISAVVSQPNVKEEIENFNNLF